MTWGVSHNLNFGKSVFCILPQMRSCSKQHDIQRIVNDKWLDLLGIYNIVVLPCTVKD